MKKLLFTNVAYGDLYADLFLNQHLKSLLDETNIPAVKERIMYTIFTDTNTYKKITKHKNYLRLRDLIGKKNLEVEVFKWQEGGDHFEDRYSVLTNFFKVSAKLALERECWLSAIVADLVAAKEFLPRVLRRMDEGHGAVFMLPLRSAAECMVPYLDARTTGALHDFELCALGFQNLHPLWVACHWNATQFTKLPFTLLWNSGAGQGIMARSFSITPVVLEPTPDMLKGRGMIDRDIPAHCRNPYWATNWTDAPIIGVEPLVIRPLGHPDGAKPCYYPPFGNHVASVDIVANWSRNLDPTQIPLAQVPLYYPNKELANIPPEMLFESDKVMDGIVDWRMNQ